MKSAVFTESRSIRLSLLAHQLGPAAFTHRKVYSVKAANTERLPFDLQIERCSIANIFEMEKAYSFHQL